MAIWYARTAVKTTGGWQTGNQTQLGGVIGEVALSVVGSLTVTALSVAPVTRYFCTSVFLSGNTLVGNGVVVYLLDQDGTQNPNLTTVGATGNHPAGHPTRLTSETGWVCFSVLTGVQNQVNKKILVMDQAGTVGQSGVSIDVTPQLTNNGNG